jgi:hypothetical protein
VFERVAGAAVTELAQVHPFAPEWVDELLVRLRAFTSDAGAARESGSGEQLVACCASARAAGGAEAQV